MIRHSTVSDSEIKSKIRQKEICLGGNRKLKIYGKLGCGSGKRMKRENRVFFLSEKEAKDNGYRPCGHCMKIAYQKWKNGFIQ
ncbi:Ada metal-binding domain-containing protein [Aquimarina sediminis]|uniref:Ada metal-binding domain-containing protein n=1 Tax=Aquimarina sediminis TaxID=2070536 RepID=UPI000CA0073D|nr:Ada metal-binding domain-containing protein [Aquimarina sediminis]